MTPVFQKSQVKEKSFRKYIYRYLYICCSFEQTFSCRPLFVNPYVKDHLKMQTLPFLIRLIHAMISQNDVTYFAITCINLHWESAHLRRMKISICSFLHMSNFCLKNCRRTASKETFGFRWLLKSISYSVWVFCM